MKNSPGYSGSVNNHIIRTKKPMSFNIGLIQVNKEGWTGMDGIYILFKIKHFGDFSAFFLNIDL